MKRAVVITMVFFILTHLVACSPDNQNVKTEEELRKEIKAELEAEMKDQSNETISESKNSEESKEVDSNNTNTANANTAEVELDNQSVENDISKGYEFSVEEGNLYLTYNNTKDTVTLIEANNYYNVSKDEGMGPTTFEWRLPSVLSAKPSADPSRLYFAVSPTNVAFPVIYTIDLNTMGINWINSGEFVMELSWDSDTTYVVLAGQYDGFTEHYVYDINGKWICDLGRELDKDIKSQIAKKLEEGITSIDESENLQGFNDESINGTHIGYSDYYAAIVPMYNGVNNDSLQRISKSMGSVTQGQLSMEVSFAIFGRLDYIRVTYYEGMDSEGETIELGDLSNSNVNIQIYGLAGDMSYVKVNGIVPTGDGTSQDMEFTLDNMRDTTDYEVYLYKRWDAN